MTKQKPGADEKTSAPRARASKTTPPAGVLQSAKSSLAPEENIARGEEEPSAALAAPVVVEAAPVVAEAAAEIIPPAPAPQPAEPPAQIVLLVGETETNGREERSAVSFSWSVRSLEFWRDNTQALYRLAGELGAARTPSEIIEAHSKFAVERLRAFGRHAEEMSTVRVKYFFAA